MRLVLRNDLENWASTFQAKGDFPILVSMLARATSDRSTLIDFPSGSAVFVGGWDGIVKATVRTEYIPDGTSLWEFGTGDENVAKANEDYEKRTKNPLGEDPSKSTFIFVTPTFFKDKNTWRNEKMKDGIWADIRVYDSSTLEQWLEIATVVARWFCGKIGKHSDGVLTATEFWEEWSSMPKGKRLPSSSVTAGRAAKSKELQDFLAGPPGIMAVKAQSKPEAVAFMIASANQFDSPDKEYFFAKTIVAETVSVIRQFNGSQVNMNIIANVDTDSGILHTAVGKGHHVLVPLGPDDPYSSQDIIELSGASIDKEGLINALMEMDENMSRDSAANYVKESGCNITILKRLIGYQHKLEWATQENVQEIIPAMLLGRWDEKKEGDVQILEQLSGEKYDEYIKKVTKWKDSEAALFLNIGTSWRLTSPMDSWTNLSQFLSKPDYQKLHDAVISVLTLHNPALDIEPDKRHFASFFGKESVYSSWSREGLLQSLILIGLYGNPLKLPYITDPQIWVDGVIAELLAKDEGKLWASLNYQMPLIAEASPISFLNAVEKSLEREDRPIMEMFSEEASLITQTSRHTGLLWALEGLAWMPEYLYRSTLALVKLAAIDPGGNLANRPINSLKEIFKAWHYQTFANYSERMDVLKLLAKKETNVMWSLLSTMLPKGGNDVGQFTHKTRWRLFNHNYNIRYTHSETFKTYSEVVDILLSIFDFTEDKLASLIKSSMHMSADDLDKVLNFVEQNYDKVPMTSYAPWHALRDILHWENSHRDKDDMTDAELERYQKLYDEKEPNDEIQKSIWMFNDHWPHFPEGYIHDRTTTDAQYELIHQRRLDALTKIYNDFGFDKIKQLAKEVTEQYAYGNTLAYILKDKDEIISLLSEFLKEENSSFMNGFLIRKSFLESLNWIVDLFSELKAKNIDSKELAKLFVPVLPSKELWKILEKEPEIEKEYWLRMNQHFHNLSEEDTIYGLNKLIEAKRFLSGMDAVLYSLEKVPSELIVQLLEKMATEDSNDTKQVRGYEIGQLFETLDKRGDVSLSVMQRLEWYYLSILTSFGTSREPQLLYNEMSKNPDFFVDLLKWAYLPKDRSLIPKEREGISEKAFDQRAQQSFNLLNNWKKIPGVDENGVLDEEFLNDWVSKVREKAIAVSRTEAAEMSIGNILAQYPEGDNNFNSDAIFSVIEEINTDRIKNNFSSALFNKRGSSSRGPFDGGNIERGHSKHFSDLARKVKNKYPYVSDIFEQLSRNYEADAKRMDEDAQRDKLDYA